MDEAKKYTFENPEYRKRYWHTSSHIMAQAVKRLWPEVKLAIGPSIAEGWYYDLYAPFAFTPEHMEQIEAEMKKIIKEKLPLERFELPREEALEFMKDEPFKVELINDLPEDEAISFYRQGEFTDLCAGPHVDSTGRIKANAFKLTACNASYWRGDSNRESLQRIYGIGFPKKDELDAYLQRIEEAKKRDHRRLGRELGLYAFRDEAPGMPFYLPKGMVLRNTLLDYWHEMHDKWDYVEISTPQIMKRSLWETSGHWDHYKDNMYTTVIDEEDFAIKPMNCPGTILVYDLEPHSYRDLPMRCAELGWWTKSMRNSDFRIISNCPPCRKIISARKKTGMLQLLHWPMPSPVSVRNISSMKATVPSTDRNWTSMYRILWDAPGSAVPSSWITSCPDDLIWNTPDPMVRSILR